MLLWERNLVGGSLIFAGISVVPLMFWHPTTFDATVASAWVHGGMIGISALSMIGIAYLALVSTHSRAVRLTVMLLYGTGSMLNTIAAAINGFAIPEVVASFGSQAPQDLISFAWALNQTLATVAVVFHATAMITFGLQPLCFHRIRMGDTFRIIGCITGLLTLGILVIHRGQINVHTALALYGLEALWIVFAGVMLVMSQENVAVVTRDKNA